MAYKPVSSEEYTSFITESVAALNAQDLVTFKDDVEYQGFDFKLLMGIMKKLSEENKRSLKTDVMKLIMLALTRGTKIEKITEKMKVDKKSEVMDLVRVYKISSNVNTDKNALTLGRVMSVFPVQTFTVMVMTKHVPTFVHKDWPTCLSFPGAPALFPLEAAEGWFKKWMRWNKKFTEGIKGNDAGEKFGRAILSSGMLSEKVKVKAFLEMQCHFNFPKWLVNDVNNAHKTNGGTVKLGDMMNTLDVVNVFSKLKPVSPGVPIEKMSDADFDLVLGKILARGNRSDAEDFLEEISNTGGLHSDDDKKLMAAVEKHYKKP